MSPSPISRRFEADLNVLNALIEPFELAEASEREVAVAWTVRKLTPRFDRIKDHFYRQWHEEMAKRKQAG